MITRHQIGLAGVVIVAAIASGASFTLSSIYGSTNVTSRSPEQHMAGNNFNDDTDNMSSSAASSSQISPYSGQEIRDIKSLSDNDVQSLQNGTGEAFGGIAKLAELNGYPGPRHVLDIAQELQLTDRQRMEIELIYQNMSNNAKSIGSAIIGVEQDMDEAFANKTITEENLIALLDKSANLYGQLRFIHLSAHLDTAQIMTTEQIQMYNEMRGYDGGSIDNSSVSNNDNRTHQQHLMQ
jgi:Spy/CpxP family protein refolding chaperone